MAGERGSFFDFIEYKVFICQENIFLLLLESGIFL